MRIFIATEMNSCFLNYQHDYIFSELSSCFEITKDVSCADIIVIAQSCTCTEANIFNTLDYINKILKNKKDGAKVYLTGCITRKFKEVPILMKVERWIRDNVDEIIPQNQPNLLLKLISEEQFGNKDINDFGILDRYSDEESILYISNGCLNNCSFCKITYQKYPLKSSDINELKETIDFLNEENIPGLILKGTNVCQYGLDMYHRYMLPEVIDYIEGKDNIKDVSLVGFSFKDAIKNDFKDVLRKSTKVSELSGGLESGSDRILSLMRKGFTSQEIIDFVKYIGQDNYKKLYLNVISGFPTENIDDVRRTLEVLEQLDPYMVYLFKYINSSFVDSNRFDQLIDKDIRNHTSIYSKTLKKRGIKYRIY